MKEAWNKLGRARNRGVPIIILASPDIPATLQGLRERLNGEAPMLHWSLASGFAGLNTSGTKALRDLTNQPEVVTNPVEALLLAAKTPAKTIVVAEGLGSCLSESGSSGAAVTAALLALRDAYKQNNRIMILLESQVPQLPALANDTLLIEEALPDREGLAVMLDALLDAARLKLDAKLREAALDAVTGLSLFAAEQAVALSLNKSALDLAALWERKRGLISQTPGLSVRADKETFGDVGGVSNIKEFLRKLVAGKYPPRCILFIDEIEKALAGAQGDTSGVSQDYLGVLLTWLQDKGVSGMIFVGPPGSAKSLVAKCAGNEAGCPTVTLDLGGMKAQFVGQSEGRIRQALKVVDAVGGDRVLAIATCLTGDTLVERNDGALVPIANLTVGEEVITIAPSGEKDSARISARRASHSVNVIEIETLGLPIRCTTDHLLYRWCPEGIETTPAGAVGVGDWLAAPRGGSRVERPLPEAVDDPRARTWLGFDWLRVKRVTPLPPSQVYDISIAHENHTFVAAGLVVHNCNNLTILPPELRRRFCFGTFFFDLPDAEERKVIWDIYKPKYGVKSAVPNDEGWTGAEIKQCCVLADALGITLKDAANYIVPVARVAREQIERLRKMADGTFISASYSGPYRADQGSQTAAVGKRAILADA